MGRMWGPFVCCITLPPPQSTYQECFTVQNMSQNKEPFGQTKSQANGICPGVGVDTVSNEGRYRAARAAKKGFIERNALLKERHY